MLLIDLTHTSHTAANTGIQRQARGVYRALAQLTATTPVCLDPYAAAWRPLDELEQQNARGELPVGSGRGMQWTLAQKLRGWRGRFTRRTPRTPAGVGLVCPEIFSPAVAARQPELFARCEGPRIAVFFDAIPLTHPELTPPKTVARFPSYLQELLRFDGVAAISHTTADSLTGYWRWLGLRDCPPVTVVPLGVDLMDSPPPPPRAPGLPQILCVSSVE